MIQVLIGGALGGVFAAMITFVGVLTTSRWRIAEENIIKQRAEWRDAVRSLISQAMVVDDALEARKIWAELALRMNPKNDAEKDDRELVALVGSLEDRQNQTHAIRSRIVDLAAHILKHDWTRAKWEARGWLWDEEPKQTRYDSTL